MGRKQPWFALLNEAVEKKQIRKKRDNEQLHRISLSSIKLTTIMIFSWYLHQIYSTIALTANDIHVIERSARMVQNEDNQ